MEKKDFEFKKTVCERYDIHFGHSGWAIFTIDENGGLFNCQSDYGDYNYSWPNHGRKSFKHFILELARDSSYFLGKVSSRSYFDFKANLKRWKLKVIEMRKDKECTMDQARKAWNVIISLTDYSRSPHLIQKEIYESAAITTLCGDEPWCYFDTDLEYPPDAVFLAEKVMPIFAEILREEIESEEMKKTVSTGSRE